MPAISMRTYTTAILCLTVFFLYADQNLLAPNLTAIANSFGFDAHERDQKLGGNVAFGFFIVGGSFALLIGYFTDIVNRCMLFGIVVSLGETACLATYWVQNYEQLLVCRILTGISFGGATPIIYSILGDYYAGSSRIYVSTMVGVASGAGISFGQFLSGMIGPVLGWRAPFLIIAIPAIICAVITFLTVDEPKRGECEDAVRQARQQRNDKSSHNLSATTTSLLSPYQTSANTAGNTAAANAADNKNVALPCYIRDTGSVHVLPIAFLSPIHDTADHHDHDYEESKATHTHTHTHTALDNNEIDEEDNNNADDYSEKIELQKVVQLFQTPSVVIIFLQGFPGCLPWGMIYTFLNDYLSEDRGLTVQAATAALTCFGCGGLVGQIFGGWFGQRLYNQNPQYQAILMGSSTLLAVLPALYILNTKEVGDLGFYFMSTLFGFIVNINGPNVRAVLQNVCMPEIRGTAFSFFTLTDDIGKGLGPALVVLLIADFHGNRQSAFNTVVLMWIFCGVMLLALTLTMKKDESAMQQRIAEAMLQRRLERQQRQQQAAAHIAESQPQSGAGSCNSDDSDSGKGNKGMIVNPMVSSFPSPFPLPFPSLALQQHQAQAQGGVGAGYYSPLINPSSSSEYEDIKVEDYLTTSVQQQSQQASRHVHFQSPAVVAMSPPETWHDAP